MNENSTQQLILQFVYGESDPSQELVVRNILASDPIMQRYYLEISEVKNKLDTYFEEPHPTSVAIIAEHSHDSHTEAV